MFNPSLIRLKFTNIEGVRNFTSCYSWTCATHVFNSIYSNLMQWSRTAYVTSDIDIGLKQILVDVFEIKWL